MKAVVGYMASKLFRSEQVKLNIGSGPIEIEGFENVDRKDGKEAYPLDYKRNSVDEIRASHILEHFSYRDTVKVLHNWVDKLKVGGPIKIAVPDATKIMKSYLDGSDDIAMTYLLGGHVDENDHHEAIFDEETLKFVMGRAGLENITKWKSEVEDCASLPISLNLMGTKSVNRSVARSMVAVMSMPRVCFTSNMKSLTESMKIPGMTIEMGTGAFWEQTMSTTIDKVLGSDPEYILAIDYDTLYDRSHIEALVELMELYPEVDCIFPAQIMRENERVLAGLINPDCTPKTDWTEEDANAHLVPAMTGQFALTIFRAKCFKGLKKPWIHGQPNSDGEWKENRLDPDIYFWHNWHNSGFTAAMSPQVKVGHMNLMATYPNDKMDGIVHKYVSEVEKNGMPEWCVPNIKGAEDGEKEKENTEVPAGVHESKIIEDAQRDTRR